MDVQKASDARSFIAEAEYIIKCGHNSLTNESRSHSVGIRKCAPFPRALTMTTAATAAASLRWVLMTFEWRYAIISLITVGRSGFAMRTPRLVRHYDDVTERVEIISIIYFNSSWLFTHVANAFEDNNGEQHIVFAISTYSCVCLIKVSYNILINLKWNTPFKGCREMLSHFPSIVRNYSPTFRTCPIKSAINFIRE